MDPRNETPNTPTTDTTPVTPVVDTDTAVPPSEETSSDAEIKTTAPKSKLIVAAVAVLLIALGGGGYYFYTAKKDDSVAIVNGLKIARAEFNESVALIKQSAAAQGVNLAEPNIETEITNQAIESLINDKLLMEDARKTGIASDETLIKTERDIIVQSLGGEELLKTRMAEVGLTEEKLRDSIIIKKYIESKTDIEIVNATTEEIKAFYDTLPPSEDLPTLEELSPQIEQQIITEKQQAIVTKLISDLRTTAEIEVTL